MIEPAETVAIVAATEPAILERYATILRDNGYIVLPRERRVFVTFSRAVSQYDLHRAGHGRIMELVREEISRGLMRESVSSGLVTFERGETNFSMGSTVFKATAAFIRPKGDDDEQRAVPGRTVQHEASAPSGRGV